MPADEMNAATMGRETEPIFAITTSMLRSLDDRELRAIIAHEIVHLAQHDLSFFRLVTMLQVLTIGSHACALCKTTPPRAVLICYRNGVPSARAEPEGSIQQGRPQIFSAISKLFGDAPIPPSWTGLLAEHGGPTHQSDLPPFEPDVARAMARRFISAPEVQEAILVQIDAILDDDALGLAAAIASHFLFDAPDSESNPRHDLIAPTDAVAPEARLFYVPLFLARIPWLLGAHADLGITVADSEALLSDIERWIGDYRSRHGVIGFDNVRWLYNHFRLRLFQFGRLQFEPREFDWPFRVFERASGDEYLALVETGHRFRSDGQFADADLGSHFPPRDLNREAAGTTAVTTTADRITGNPVDDHGRILSPTTTMRRKEWSELIAPGSPVLAVHIPASGPLEPDAVSESFARAASFFASSALGAPARMFTCDSWLMDRQLDAYLGHGSNIVAFQRRFLPLPLPGATDRQHFERVFGEAPVRLEDAPQENTLQRALVAHIRSGLSWRNAGGIAPVRTSGRTAGPV